MSSEIDDIPAGESPATRTDRTELLVRGAVAVFAAVLAVILAMAWVSVRSVRTAERRSDVVNHALSVVLETGDIAGCLSDAQDGLESFLATGGAGYRAQCANALSEAEEHSAALQALVRADPRQAARAARVDRLLRERRDYDTALMSGPTGSRSPREAGGGGSATAIKSTLSLLRGAALEELSRLDTESVRQARATGWTVLSGSILNLALLTGAVWLVGADLAARRRRAVELGDQNRILEEAVARATEKLREANGQLEGDLREEQWANLAMEQQMRYNELVFSALREPVLVLTRALGISRANPAALHLIGLDAAQVINKPLHAFVTVAPVDGSAGPVSPVARAIGEGRDLEGRLATVAAAWGRSVPVSLTMHPLRDSGRVVGGVLVLASAPAASTP